MHAAACDELNQRHAQYIEKLRAELFVEHEALHAAACDELRQRYEEDIDSLEKQNEILIESNESLVMQQRRLATASATKRENSVITDMAAKIVSTQIQIAALEALVPASEGIVHAAEQAELKLREAVLRQQGDRLDEECVVCLENQRTTALIPCGHRAVCNTCARDMKECPLCRAAVTSTQRVFL